MQTPTDHETKVFKVQRTRFCNLFNVPEDTQFTKEWLISVVNSDPASLIEYNNKQYQITFTMKYLAKQMLFMEFHTFI